MKPKSKLLSLLLTICLVAGLMPTAVFAAGTDTGKAIQLGTSGIAGYDSAAGYDYIYFGSWTAQDTYTTSGPIKWRVLDDQTNTGETGLFLLSDGLLGTGYYGGVYFDNTSPYSNTWQGSDAQAWCNTFASSNLDSRELAAILETTKSDDAFSSSTYSVPFDASENILNGDKVFFLSAEEAENSAYGFANDNARIANYGGSACAWWLRSPYAGYTDGAGAVYGYGYVDFITVDDDWAARPAFNLDLTSVLFTSAAAGGKSASGMDSGLTAVGDYDGSEWKLTLLDDSRDFSISNAAIEGSTVTFSYSNAKTGENEYISAVIENNGEITHYGRILQLDGTESGASGIARLTLPEDVTLSDTTKLYVFNEQYNGGEQDDTKLTDYASAFETVALTVSSDTTAPTLTPGSATRDSETDATVRFTSDEAGTYYYAVVESGEMEPTIDTTGEGTSCISGENTISLTNLSGAGAKDIYIVAKDAAENVSQQLKITIPAYIAPSYGISASPAALNFGSETEGYADAPAAQTVTIKNIGKLSVTVDLPTSAKYTITAGTGFENGDATLASDDTATFTVQPNTGLGAGDYSETLTISGSDGTSANVQLSFAVTETAPVTYTLTVELNGGSGNATDGEYPAGKDVNIDAGTRSGYRFVGWTSSNGGTFADPSSASTTFTMPAADTTITANWEYNGGGSTGGSTTDYYRLTFDTNGGSEISSIRRAEYTTIDLTDYTPTREGYEFTGWYADEDLTEKITSIRLIRNTTVYAGWEEIKENPGTGFENPFTDVSENDWFFNDVKFVYQNGLMNGTSATTFSPEGTTSRGMIVTILWRMAGSPDMEDKIWGYPFADVDATAYYGTAVYWARLNGIAGGYDDATFGPNDPITREQMAAILYRYAQYKGYDVSAKADLNKFTDADEISNYALEALQWANAEGLINGKGDGVLDPKGQATRAEAAAILTRFCEQYAEK